MPGTRKVNKLMGYRIGGETAKPPRSHWNYRLVKGNRGAACLSEVHYKNGKPYGYAPAQLDLLHVCHDTDELRWVLGKMLEGLDKRPLSRADFKARASIERAGGGK